MFTTFNFACWEMFACFLLSVDFFFKINFFKKKIFKDYHQSVKHFVWPDLGPPIYKGYQQTTLAVNPYKSGMHSMELLQTV